MFTSSAKVEQFVRLVTRHQRGLYMYVCALVPTEDAEDILQETYVVLWKKFGEFDPDRDFFAWARGIARFEVLKYRQRLGREVKGLDPEVIEALGAESEQKQKFLEARQAALNDCLKKLRQKDRRLIQQRYAPGVRAKQLADKLGRSVNSLNTSLHRIRRTLWECVNRTVPTQAAGGET